MSKIKKTKLLPPYLVLGSMFLMYLLDRVWPIYIWHNTRLFAYIVMSSAFLCILYCAYIFHKNNTEIKPLEESRHLILSWPYNFSRNPIYLCMILFLIGWCLWLQSASCLVVVIIFAVWIHYRFILQEEQMLQDTFGNVYREYKQRVRRWL